MPSKLELAIASLDVLVPIAKAVPILGPTVEGSLEAAKKILEYAKGVQNNKKATGDLAEDAALWVRDIVATVNEVRHEVPRLHALESDVCSLLAVLEKIALFLSEQKGRSRLKAALNKAEDAEKLGDLRNELKSAHDRFMVKVAIRLEVAVQNINSKAEMDSLSKLEPVIEAAFDAPGASPSCLPGTRGQLLNDVSKWFEGDDPSQKRIFWLNGLAGTGKTTVARSIARKYRDLGRLAGAFFFSRNDAKLRDPLAVIPTLAYDIADRFSTFRALICAGADSDPFVRRKSIEVQGQVLFGRLGRAVRPREQLLLVLDAMDECECSDRRDYARLVAVVTSMPDTFKLFITSRSANHFKDLFGSLDSRQLALHYDIADHVVQSDIHLYLQQQLGDFGLTHRLPVPFPKPQDLNELVNRAGTLFIYASTIVKWITDADEDPIVRLDQLLKQNVTDAQFHYRTLDMLYDQILSQAAITTGDPEKHTHALHTFLSTIVLLQEPLPVAAVAYMSDVKHSDVLTSRLSAAIMVDGNAVRVYHASFPDFITSRDRCSDARFLVVPSEGHEYLARRCLELMNIRLRRDICDIRDPSLFNSEVADLAQRLDDNVPRYLRYACKYWHVHTVLSGELSHALMEDLSIFCNAHLHHWLEILSLMKELSASVRALTPLLRLLRSSTELQGNPVQALLADIQRLAVAYQEPIEASALHVYHSAIVTMPLCHLRDKMTRESHIPVLISERSAGWGMEKMFIVGHGNTVTSVAFLVDGKSVVSGSGDHTVRVWNATTGAQQHILTGHNSWVSSIACSANGQLIVSGCADSRVHVWDATTGTLRYTLIGHTDVVTSVALSADGQTIVSGSYDCTVRVWDASTGTQRRILTGHGELTCVAISLDGKFIASSAWDENDTTVRLWDAVTGIQIWIASPGEWWAWSVAFSADSAKVVLGCGDGTVRVWDATSGTQQRVFTGHIHAVTCAKFSTNGKSIVSSSEDYTIRIWDTGTGIQRHVITGHHSWVKSVALSPDNNLIVSGSSDRTVRVWEMVTDVQQQVIGGHNNKVNSLAFSVDGKPIVSGSYNGTVCVWNAATGALHHILTGHDVAVTSVAFSADGKSIVSRSKNHDIRVWDEATGVQIDPSVTESQEMTIVPDHPKEFNVNMATGWISRRSTAQDTWQRVFWLPIERRGDEIASHGHIVCVGAGRSAAITILDLSRVV